MRCSHGLTNLLNHSPWIARYKSQWVYHLKVDSKVATKGKINKRGQSVVATIIGVLVLILSAELWGPLAFIFAVIKLVATFSFIVAWEAFKSVPIWIWDFTLSLFT